MKLNNILTDYPYQTDKVLHIIADKTLSPDLLEALSRIGYKAINIYKGYTQFFNTHKPNPNDVILPLVSGGKGFTYKYLITAYCRQFGLQTPNPSEREISILQDKLLLHLLLKEHNIPTPRLLKDIPVDDNVLIIPKPRNAEYSKGISVSDIKPIEHYKDTPLKDDYIYQEFIKGIEIEIPLMVINNQVIELPVRLPKTTGNELGVLDEKVVHSDNYTLNYTPPTKEHKQLFDIAKQVYDVIGSNTFLRVDFIVDKDNKPYVMDISNSLSFSEENIYLKSFLDAGLTYQEAVMLRMYRG